MFELSVRLIGVGFLTLVAGLTDAAAFEVIWRAAVVVAAYSVVGYQLESRNMKNPGIAGFIAAADACAIACALASVHRLDDFGFLVLAPCAYAAARYGSLPTAMAPLAAASLLGASVLVQDRTPSTLLMCQAGAVLVLGLLLNHRRIVVTTTREIDVTEPLAIDVPDAYMELRESFRKLKEMYRDLEGRNKADHWCRQFYEARLGQGDTFHKRLGAKLKELTGAERLAVYTLAQFSNTLVVRTVVGDYPDTLQDAGVEVDLSQAAIVVRERTEQALRAIVPPEQRSTLASTLLNHQGRLVGMVSFGHSNPARIEEARRDIEDMSAFLAALLVDDDRRAVADSRLRETEVLYEVAVTSWGSSTPTSLAARVVREMFPVLDVDHLSVAWLDGEETIQAAHAGVAARFLESMDFGEATGIPGWLARGASETVVFNVADDARCKADLTLRLRINSFCAIPIQFTEKPYGYIAAATHRVGGIDVATVATLRSVAAEMGQAISRLLQGPEAHGDGLTTAAEFQQYVTRVGEGCMVVLETLRKDQLFDTFGKPAVDHALRQLAVRLRARLPQGAALCRRQSGDFAAFLVGCDETFASSWANEVAAIASMIGLRTPDGRARIPLAVRARVAQVTMKASDAFTEVVA
jgi:GAF domain-containing protein